MRLKLKNFKKYLDKEIELPDKGLLLLSGDSGAGKSSIIKAILYALFGQIKSPYSFGTNTCSVTLEYLDLTIIRTSSPNTLQVIKDGETFEKTAAQGVIDNILKQDYQRFMLASYIPQKNNSSILSLTPTDQLSLIQLLSFSNDEYSNKEILKKIMKAKSDELYDQQTKTDYLQQRYDNLAQNFESVDFPLEIKDNEEDTINNYKQTMKEFTTKIVSLNNERKRINIEIQNRINLEHRMTLKTEKKEMYEGMLEEKKEELKIVKTKLEKIPTNLDKELEIIKNNIEYNNLLIRLKELDEEYSEILINKNTLHENQDTLWPNQDKEKSELNLEYLKQGFLNYEYLQKINTSLGLKLTPKDSFWGLPEMKKYIKTELQTVNSSLKKETENKILYAKQKEDEKHIRTCPGCGMHLKINDKKLVPGEKIDTKTLDDLIKKNTSVLKELEEKLTKLKEAHDLIGDADDKNINNDEKEIIDLEEYIRENDEKEKDINKNLNICESNLQKIDEKKTKLKTSLDLKKVINPKSTSELNEKYNELELLSSQMKSLKKDHENIIRKCKELEKNINALNTEIDEIDEVLSQEDQNDILEKIEQELENIENEYKEYKEVEADVDKYLEYKNKEDNLINLQEELDEEYEKLKILDLEYKGFIKLKEKYLKAEIMSLNVTLHNINQHTEYFLEKFFNYPKLSATLNISGEDDKLKVGTRITYLGNEYDKISELSGGEFDRCTLASVCGINTLLSSPILILDESLSALNSAINTDIISFLKELANNKLIIVCSHEAVRGIFDEIKEIS